MADFDPNETLGPGEVRWVDEPPDAKGRYRATIKEEFRLYQCDEIESTSMKGVVVGSWKCWARNAREAQEKAEAHFGWSKGAWTSVGVREIVIPPKPGCDG